MFSKFLQNLGFRITPPLADNGFDSSFANNLKNDNSLKLFFLFILSRFLYVYSFGFLYALFVSHGISEQDYFYRSLEWALLPSIFLVAIFVLVSPYNKYLEIFFYFWGNFWNTVCIFQAILFQTRFDTPTMDILFTSDIGEGAGFLLYFVNIKILLILLSVWLIPLLLWKISNKIQYSWNYKQRILIVLSSLVLLLFPAYLSTSFLEQYKNGLFFKASNIDKNLRSVFWVENATFIPKALNMSTFASSIPDDVIARYTGAQNVILFITESTNRNMMSIYGYPRETNPRLGEMDLIVYDDIISSAADTARSIPLMLTFADIQHNTNYITTMHDLFKGAGFETHGYSGEPNMNKNHMLYVLQSRADNFTLRDETGDAGMVLDAIEILKNNPDKKNFILIFTFAAHGPYNKFYPSDFQEFTGTPPQLFDGAEPTRRNHYDTSIKHLDYIISNLLEEVEKLGNTAVLVTSDHGQEVANYSTSYGHSHKSNYLSSFEIPFFVFLTSEYKDKMQHLVFDTTRPYQTDNLIHSIMDLANIESPLFNPQKSIFNKEFIEVQRFMHEEDYENVRAKYNTTKNKDE